jgi:hypothetical protein
VAVYFFFKTILKNSVFFKTFRVENLKHPLNLQAIVTIFEDYFLVNFFLFGDFSFQNNSEFVTENSF